MKKNKAPLTQSLSKVEFDWLQNFLNTVSQTHDDSMTMEAVDGLFCALIINPVMAKPTEWMKIIFGETHEFKSEEELDKVLHLLVRYWNHTSLLIEKNDSYFPYVIESEEHLAQQWIKAFRRGMDYCRNEWDAFIKENDNMTLLSPFLVLEQDENLTNNNRDALLALIPAMAYKLFHYWIEKAHNENIQPKLKVGRNDPCPCGSGKKYKKCCDA
jgi:uncharacterized protein